MTTSAFGYATGAEKEDWANLVAPIEASLRLHHHKPGTLLRQAAYLHQRTGGMIGSLDQLIQEAAIGASIGLTGDGEPARMSRSIAR